MQNNNRMGMPGMANSQPRMMRPVLNFNYMPGNNNNSQGQGYMQRYPASGVPFRSTAPMYHQAVYQDYQQPYMNDEYSANYFGIQGSQHESNSQSWSEPDYFQYMNERANQSQMIPQNNYPPQYAQVDHTARFLQRTAATAPQVARHPMTNQKRNANNAFGAASASQQSQKISKNNGYVKVPRRQNQPMAMLPVPKPVNHSTNKPVQRKPHIVPLKQQQQKVQPETNGKKKQTQTQMTESQSKEFAYKGKVDRDRVLMGTIPQLMKWRSARHKTPPVYGTVGIIDGRSNLKEDKSKVEDQFILCSLKEWNCNAVPSVKELMDCVVFTSEHRQQIFPIGECVRIVGRFIPDGTFHVLKIRSAYESDINYLSCIFKNVPFKPDNSFLDRSFTIPSTFDASGEEPETSTAESYQHVQKTMSAPIGDNDYLFQPY